MQPLKITIPGDYWDCQLYSGYLYLWLMDGSVKVVNWHELIEDLIKNDSEQLPFTCSFLRGDYLYKGDWSLVFQDSEFRSLLEDKFYRVQAHNLDVSPQTLAKFITKTQDNPFEVLHTDSDIYNNKIYAALDSGLWSATTNRKSQRYFISSRPVKLHDISALSLKANSNRLALSAGDEGLYEYSFGHQVTNYGLIKSDPFDSIVQLDKRHSSHSSWNFTSIYSSSYVDSGYLAAFGWKKYEGSDEKERVFQGTFSDSDIFKTERKGFSWGSQEKLYMGVEGGLKVVCYTQAFASKDKEFEDVVSPFKELEFIEFAPWKGEIIGGDVAHFGTIIECENALVVYKSDKSFYNITGPITRWRVYPRSKLYINQLHVVLEDKIEIYSFNHDYFLNQDDKTLGIKFSDWTPIRG